jgi:hypothetical protein
VSISPVFSVLIIAGAVAAIGALLIGLRRAGAHGAALLLPAAALLTWFVACLLAAGANLYVASAEGLPTIQYGIVLPIVLGILASRLPAARRWLAAMPQAWLIGVQLYRVLGAIFLVLYGLGRLPGLFAWPAGLADIAIGICAPVIAVMIARAPEQTSDVAQAWNLLGIADLAVAVGLGFLTSSSPMQLFAFDCPSDLLTRFPLVLIPTFMVPLAVLLHLASLAKLRRKTAMSGQANLVAPA